MKKLGWILLGMAAFSLSGCQSIIRAWDSNPTIEASSSWDGKTAKRSRGTATGVDPQAQDIEQRLGYR